MTNTTKTNSAIYLCMEKENNPCNLCMAGAVRWMAWPPGQLVFFLGGQMQPALIMPLTQRHAQRAKCTCHLNSFRPA